MDEGPSHGRFEAWDDWCPWAGTMRKPNARCVRWVVGRSDGIMPQPQVHVNSIAVLHREASGAGPQHNPVTVLAPWRAQGQCRRPASPKRL